MGIILSCFPSLLTGQSNRVLYYLFLVSCLFLFVLLFVCEFVARPNQDMHRERIPSSDLMDSALPS